MPANRGLGSPNWNPQPDFPAHMEFSVIPDERVFNIYKEEDVAVCLVETDPLIDVHKWSLSDEEIQDLAFESAQRIVQQRKELLMNRQLEIARRARTSGRVAVVAGIVENLATGEVTSYATEVPMGKVFG